MKPKHFLCLLLFATNGISAEKEKPKPKPGKPAVDNVAAEAARAVGPLAEWVEPDFPFFSSVLDARDVGDGFPKDNLTPRGIILNLGHNLWACFDTDLLRIACIWQGEEGKPPITQNALAPGSYQVAGQKTKDGQDDLPKPTGKVWLANGIYPGWQVLNSPDEKPSFIDPREPGLSKEEVGRGPLDDKYGKMRYLSPNQRGVGLCYRVGTTVVMESVSRDKGFALEVHGTPPRSYASWTREFKVAAHIDTLLLHVGRASQHEGAILNQESAYFAFGDPPRSKLQIGLSRELEPRVALRTTGDGYVTVMVPPSTMSQEFSVTFRIIPVEELKVIQEDALSPNPPHQGKWPQTVTTQAKLSQKDDSYVIDDIPLPLPNPWKRNVRLADIAFYPEADGHAAAVTMDGDVWMISGIKGDLNEVKWKRFASGLHEPMSIVIRKDEGGRMKDEKASSASSSGIFVFDRNGIWRLRDTNNDSEADIYEMFCNKFSQTAETREFPNSMKLAPDGSFVISKGGQEGKTFGKDNGKVLRISPDGKTVTTLGHGLRGPFIGVHPRTGLVTASDQQGNYVPSTPLHIIKDNQFYGHLPNIAPKEKYPAAIADPLVWIPHPVNASGVTQVWLCDAKMGTLNEELIHLGYNRPEVFRVLTGSADSLVGVLGMRSPTRLSALPAKPQATVVPFTQDLNFAPLNGAVNPTDGQLYLAGFQIWGTTAKRISGLARIRYTGKKRLLLKELTPMDKGVLLRFNEALDPKLATDPSSYSVERWNYKRTFNYGSPHLKLDGTPGQEWMIPSSAYLSKDGLSVFIGIPDMKPVMQMRVGWGLKGADGSPAQNNAYTTPYELAKFDPQKESFADIKVDLTPRKADAVAVARPTVEEGQRLYQMIGCMACHSIDGTVVGKVGPSWKGLYAKKQTFKDNTTGTVDESYLRESIIDPNAKVVKGFEKFDAGMPIYAGILSASQIESLVLFIKTLK